MMSKRPPSWKKGTVGSHGVPCRKVESGDGYSSQRSTERSQARERGEKARRLCDADEEWFQHTVEKHSSMMSPLAMKYLGE